MNKDFIDQAVEKAYRNIIHKNELRRARINKKKTKRKIERINRRKGRR